jgi:hypothetical protein
MNPVDVVLINWKRPSNVHKIAERIREQTWPCLLTIIECAPESRFSLDAQDLAAATHVYVLRNNYGAFSRYVSAFSVTGEFGLFLDDDMLPGRRCVEHFVKAAEARPDAGLLGQCGRNIQTRYRAKDVARSADRFVEVDLVVRGYFVRTNCLPDVFRLRQALGATVREDDMVLAAAIRHICGQKILLTPAGEKDTKMNEAELPAPHALSSNPRHSEMRSRFWYKAVGTAKAVMSPNACTSDDVTPSGL